MLYPEKTPSRYQHLFCHYRQRGLLLAGLLGLLPVKQAASVMQGKERPHSVARFHVRGALTESACRLETVSVWQGMDTGSLTDRGLSRPSESDAQL